MHTLTAGNIPFYQKILLGAFGGEGLPSFLPRSSPFFVAVLRSDKPLANRSGKLLANRSGKPLANRSGKPLANRSDKPLANRSGKLLARNSFGMKAQELYLGSQPVSPSTQSINCPHKLQAFVGDFQ